MRRGRRLRWCHLSLTSAHRPPPDEPHWLPNRCAEVGGLHVECAREYGALQTCVAKGHAFDVGPSEVGVAQVRHTHVGKGEASAAEVARARLRLGEVGLKQLRALEAGAIEHELGEVSARHLRVVEDRALHGGALELSLSEGRARQVRPREVGAAHACELQVSPLEGGVGADGVLKTSLAQLGAVEDSAAQHGAIEVYPSQVEADGGGAAQVRAPCHVG
mmetsp:Transcript_23431/g.54210  ORF Transcript_23431/g.54210 Transcript_23431/m.54210 type:complete len:219 (-) Transcript_23431:57-713(-)